MSPPPPPTTSGPCTVLDPIRVDIYHSSYTGGHICATTISWEDLFYIYLRPADAKEGAAVHTFPSLGPAAPPPPPPPPGPCSRGASPPFVPPLSIHQVLLRRVPSPQPHAVLITASLCASNSSPSTAACEVGLPHSGHWWESCSTSPLAFSSLSASSSSSFPIFFLTSSSYSFSLPPPSPPPFSPFRLLSSYPRDVETDPRKGRRAQWGAFHNPTLDFPL